METTTNPRRFGIGRRQLAAAIAGGAIALGTGGVALAHAQDSTTATTTTAAAAPTTAAGQGTWGKGGRGQGRENQLAQELAQKLGLDQTTVQNAITKVRQQERQADGTTKPAGKPSAADRQAREQKFASDLATALGVDQSKVTDALTQIQSEHKTQARTTVQQRLDAAVSAGKITSGDEASILKAYDAGVLGGGMGGHGAATTGN